MKLSLCSTAYRINNGKPIITMFCRDFAGKRVVVEDYIFKPYFYIDEEGFEELGKYDSGIINLLRNKTIDSTKIIPKSKLVSIDGKQLRQIFTKIPTDVRRIRQDFIDNDITVYEADVLYHLRFLIDNNIKSGIEYNNMLETWNKPIDMPSKQRILYIDIEVVCPNKHALKKRSGPVNVIGIYDNIEDKAYFLHTLPPKQEQKIDYHKYLLNENLEIVPTVYSDEKSLLWGFVKLINKLQPDVTISFSNFDMLYILARLDKNRIPDRLLSPIHQVRMINDDRVIIGGMDVLDLAEMYRIAIEKVKWETLEAIAERELGIKMLFKDKDMYKSWYEDYRIVIWRNIRDVEAIRMLDEEKHLLTYFDTIRKVVGCNLSDVFTYLPSSKVANTTLSDILYLRHLNGKIVLHMKRTTDKKGYKGGLVFDTTKGLHENVLVIDWNSMYPSIMDTFNMSYETFSTHYYKGCYNIDNKYFFRKKPKGWTIAILDILKPMRAKMKQGMKTATDEKEKHRYASMSQSYKTINNAVYGLYGFGGKGRLANETIAECICYVGRQIQLAVKNFLDELDYEMLYGDTDSIFIQMKEGTEEEIQKFIVDINKLLKDFMMERWGVVSKLYMGRDKVFKDIMMLTKKRYRGIDENGKVLVKGIEIVKRDTAEVSAKGQSKVSDILLAKIPKSKKRNKALKYSRKLVKEFKSYPLTFIGIPKNLSRPLTGYKGVTDGFKGTPGHVKAFYKGQTLLKEPLEEGVRFYTVYAYLPEEDQTQRTLFGTPLLKKKSEAIGFLDPKSVKYEIDYETMIEKTLKNKLEDMLSLVDIEWDEVIE